MGVVLISERNPGAVVADASWDRSDRTFTYVETTEPLSVYNLW